MVNLAPEGPPGGTIFETLGIRTLEMGPDRVVLDMDVGPQVHQPAGLLHGGASAVLAESAASMGAFMNLDAATQHTVGIELNINHLSSVRSGTVTAVATPIRRGRTVHVWGIDIHDEGGKHIAVGRCTLAIRQRSGGLEHGGQ
ncbi:MAG: hotdog fold thioesterase [Actinomycetota bacterium]|nr:hotdog fold thioesterase [Actinomycetota bacterium]